MCKINIKIDIVHAKILNFNMRLLTEVRITSSKTLTYCTGYFSNP